jgi:hypothetical protein
MTKTGQSARDIGTCPGFFVRLRGLVITYPLRGENVRERKAGVALIGSAEKCGFGATEVNEKTTRPRTYSWVFIRFQLRRSFWPSSIFSNL